ncbi:uncharacterized protein LOC134280501 [Saccostrea cucullata]|uniref:uncharacterized protein LOC134280501 n=1 Tax=Saccostrea cuccullata TaxID=36930 RepID=UPI002ED3A12B
MFPLIFLIICQNVPAWMGNPVPNIMTSYNYDVHPVIKCPENASQWSLASDRLNCTTDDTQKYRYHCMPERGKGRLLEFCYPRVRFPMLPGFCIVLFKNGYMSKNQDTNCSVFTNNSCPNKKYYSDDMYKYPACSQINPQHHCYKFDPSCPPEEQTVDPSFSRESLFSTITTFANPNTETTAASGNDAYKIALPVVFVLIAVCCALICWCNRHRILKKWSTFRGIRNVEIQNEEMENLTRGEQTEECNNESAEQTEENNIESGEESFIESNIESDFLKEWQSDDKLFYDGITAVEELEERLLKNNIIMVVGGPGIGKTSLVRHIALKWHNQRREETGKELKSWKIFVISSFEELENIYNANKQSKDLQIYIFDDPIGIHALSKRQLSSLFVLYNNEKLFVKQTTKKLLMTCRRIIYEEAKESMPKIESFVLDIEMGKNKFTEDSKENIFKKHCGLVDYSPISLLPNTMFPLLCRLYAKRKDQNIIEFFTKPFDCLQVEFENMMNQDLHMYFALVLCMLNKGQLLTRENNTNELCLIGMEVLKKYLGKGWSMKGIQRKLVIATGTYIKISESNFVFIHDYMLESLAIHFGKKCPDPIIEYMSTSFLLQFLKIDDAINSNHPCIVLQRDIHEKDISLLAERVYKDINQLHLSIFTHSCWESQFFQQKLLALLDVKEYIDICRTFLVTKDCLESTENSQDFPKSTRLESGTAEWYRNELLWYKVYNNEYDYSYDIRPLRWIVANARTFLLRYLISRVTENNENVSEMFGDNEEQSLLLVLACFSRDQDMVETVFTNISSKDNINRSCVSKSVEEKYNPHREFTPLAAACYANTPSIVQYLIDQGAEVFFSSDTTDTSLLYRSLCFQKYEVCHALVDGGANLKMKDEKQRTLLHILAYQGEGALSLMKKLIPRGLDINEKDIDGKSPIYYAFERESALSLKARVDENKDDLDYYKSTLALLEEGAKPDLWDSQCRSPIYSLFDRGQKFRNILPELVKNGLDVNFVDKMGNSLLHYAVFSGDKTFVKCVLQARNLVRINQQDKMGRSALYKATEKGYLDIVELLIEQKAEVNLTDNKKFTPLYQSVEKGFISVVKVLIENGANVNENYERKKKNATPLHIATINGFTDIAELLIIHKAEVNLTDHEKVTPLYHAVKRGNLQLVEVLVENGATVNEKYGMKKNATPLHIAAREGYFEISEFLLQNGADQSLKDNENKLPKDIDSDEGHYLLENLIK